MTELKSVVIALEFDLQKWWLTHADTWSDDIADAREFFSEGQTVSHLKSWSWTELPCDYDHHECDLGDCPHTCLCLEIRRAGTQPTVEPVEVAA